MKSDLARAANVKMAVRSRLGGLVCILAVGAALQARADASQAPQAIATGAGGPLFLQDGLWWPQVVERSARRLARHEPAWPPGELDEPPAGRQAHQHHSHNQAMRQREQPNYRTTTACEGNLMELGCEDAKLIHIVRANYGRFSLTICNDFGHSNYSTQCASFRAFLYMETKCNNLTTCNVTVSRDLFGDPCVGTAKYLEVQYQCDEVNSPAGNNRQPASGANPVISTNSSARQPQGPAAPPNDHKSHSSANHNNVVGGDGPPPPAAGSPALREPAGRGDAPPGGSPTRPAGGLAEPDGADQQQQQQQLQQQQQPPVIQPQQYCAPQTSPRNLFWNFTRAGQVARQPCPEGSSGRGASWRCDEERLRFAPALSPDFSQCRSNWLARLATQLYQTLEAPGAPRAPLSAGARQQDEQMIRSILGELSLLTKTKELFGEDLRRIDIMVSQMIAQVRSAASLAGGGGQLAPLANIYSELFGQVSSICSSLFDAFQRQAWLELPGAEARRHLEERLLGHLREAGLMFARSLAPGQLAEMAPIRQPNVLAGVSVIINSQLKPTGADRSALNELNLAGRPFDDNNARLLSPEESNTEFRLQPQLVAELAADGIIKFLTLDIKVPNYPLTMMQLEQQMAAQEQAARGLSMEFSQSLAGDQNQFQKRIFGVFAINGHTGELVDVAPARHQQDPPAAAFAGLRPRDMAARQRLAELLAQWPISVEFKSQPSTGVLAQQSQALMRQCQSVSLESLGGASETADSQTANRCHLSKYNATNFVCSCDRFGFVALGPQLGPQLISQGFGLNGLQAMQNDGHLQWPVAGMGDFALAGGNQLLGAEHQGDPARVFDPAYVINKPPPAATSPGPLTYTFVVIGVALLVLSVAGLLVNVILRVMSSARLSKKHRSFIESIRNGPTTGPLAADHNLMGSNPLVSAAATTQSGSIIGLSSGGSAAMGQICAGATPTGSSSTYKTHQQLYSAHMGAHSPPMMEAYAAAGARRWWPSRAAHWLVERPARWLAGLASSAGGSEAAAKADRMIQHRIVGSNASTIGTLAYQKSQYQNGYTTSPGLHGAVQPHHTLARAFLGSAGNGSQSGVPLNPSSNSSYVSSSAYYEEIGTGNLTKVNASQLTGVSQPMGGGGASQPAILDPFMMKQQQLQRQQYPDGHHQQHQQHHHTLAASSNQAMQQQQVFRQWPAQAGANNTATISFPPPNGPATGPHNNHHHHNHLQQHQPMSLITKQHLHNDLSPLQSSSSSSTGSQHSASAGAANLTNGAANGSGATTPRHFLFASPIAVNAYKQQQQQQFRGGHHQRHDQPDR